MPRTRNPRHGTMQFWPRKRAARIFPRVRNYKTTNEAKPLGFPGYKVAMAHAMFSDNRAKSMTKGMEISCPLTIIECPSIKIASAVFYKKNNYGLTAYSAVPSQNLDKVLQKNICLPKKIAHKLEDIKKEDADDVRILVYTQPKLTTIGKKKPDLFELELGGKLEAKIEWIKNNFAKEISVNDIFKQGQQIDVHSLTKGHGIQGPVQRFGVMLRSHKSEKTKRGPGSLGPWHGPRMYRVAHQGQTGYQQRTEYNKWLLKIDAKPDEINRKGGFKHYGIVKNNYILVKGSVAGSPKRQIMMTHAMRPNSRIPSDAPKITMIVK